MNRTRFKFKFKSTRNRSIFLSHSARNVKLPVPDPRKKKVFKKSLYCRNLCDHWLSCLFNAKSQKWLLSITFSKGNFPNDNISNVVAIGCNPSTPGQLLRKWGTGFAWSYSEKERAERKEGKKNIILSTINASVNICVGVTIAWNAKNMIMRRDIYKLLCVLYCNF